MRSEDRVLNEYEGIHSGVCRFLTEDYADEGCSSVGIVRQMTFHPRAAFGLL